MRRNGCTCPRFVIGECDGCKRYYRRQQIVMTLAYTIGMAAVFAVALLVRK